MHVVGEIVTMLAIRRNYEVVYSSLSRWRGKEHRRNATRTGCNQTLILCDIAGGFRCSRDCVRSTVLTSSRRVIAAKSQQPAAAPGPTPRRTHPKTGVTHKSCLKPVGQPYTNKTVDTDKGIVSSITIEPAAPAEIIDTCAVMGGEDWEMWINALDEAKLLAPGATSVAYSYIGPELTWAVYKNGTIGLAKNDLERAGKAIDATLKANGYGRAFISVNKALVTQASSAIPVVPLYISLLYKIMKAKGTHEGCIEQIDRLFRTQMYGGTGLVFDDAGRVRIDDWEMRPEVQAEVVRLWPQVNTETLATITDIAGYRSEFLKLFGFDFPGIDYETDIDPHVELPC